MPRNTKARQLTRERHETHGAFHEVALLSHRIVAGMKTGRNYETLNVTQKMALKEIAHKAARILSGDPNQPDHWDDIGGYAHLGSEACGQTATKTVKRRGRKPAAKKTVKTRRAKKVAAKKTVTAKKAVRTKRPRKARLELVGDQEAA